MSRTSWGLRGDGAVPGGGKGVLCGVPIHVLRVRQGALSRYPSTHTVLCWLVLSGTLQCGTICAVWTARGPAGCVFFPSTRRADRNDFNICGVF
eukprot:682148-Rhodomonas_salina.1